jgi:hypothetical protein
MPRYRRDFVRGTNFPLHRSAVAAATGLSIYDVFTPTGCCARAKS